MTALIGPETVARLNGKTCLVKRMRLALCILCLAVCVFLCFGLRTGNAFRRYIEVCSVSLACGWFIIATHSRVKALQAAASHFLNLEKKQGAEHLGVLEYSPVTEVTPDGLRVRRVYLKAPAETRTLLVDEFLLNSLPPSGALARVEARGSFIWCAQEESDG
ncbi:MAG: hypothetical protein K5663_04645 [Clostridiales bacterium]|nr:hypothetical protein [Clostridiales bacterium]